MAEYNDFLDFSDISGLLLEGEPQWAYYSSAPFMTGSQPQQQAQQQYWSNQFGNVFNRYMGSLGASARQGQQGPTFQSFLEDYPFTQKYYQNVSPVQRGSYRRFAPSTRFIY